MANREPRLGVALGSGSARGWSHIGVLQALEAHGVRPEVVCGSSIGALVGAVYAAGHLQDMAEWVSGLTRRDVFGYLDVALSSGGMVEGKRLMELYRNSYGDLPIEELPRRYAAVATALDSGREVWLQRGSMLEAVRASISLPGLFTPVQLDGEWLVDGGLVNPVPVTLCRALGADVVIAVNLNGHLLGRHRRLPAEPPPAPEPPLVDDDSWLAKLAQGLRQPVEALRGPSPPQPRVPGFFEVLATSLDIMQDRITRSRMAGDPPDLVLSPRLPDMALMEFDRGKEAIAEGWECVERMLPALEDALRGVVPLDREEPPTP